MFGVLSYRLVERLELKVMNRTISSKAALRTSPEIQPV